MYQHIYRQMSAWLGRPNLIDQKNLTFKFPTLRLDQSLEEPNLLSPFAHMALQANLGRRVTTVLGDAHVADGLSAKQTLEIESECEQFIDELPAIFRIKDPDLSLDKKYPHFVFQRHQLHCVIYVTMLDFLKPYLTRDRHDKITERDDEFRSMGIDTALRLLHVARDLFEYEFPISAKFHMVVFSIFDTSTILCSAIIHDRDHVLPHREQILDAIDVSLDMLRQLSPSTKLGASSYNFLNKLVQASPELSRTPPNKKRQKQGIPIATAPLESAPMISPSSVVEPVPSIEQPPTTLSDAVPLTTTTDDLSFDLDYFLANNPFGEFDNSATFNMGGMEQIWDWENLHLDGVSHNGPVV
jgi:hypothetical protein